MTIGLWINAQHRPPQASSASDDTTPKIEERLDIEQRLADLTSRVRYIEERLRIARRDVGDVE